MSRRCGLAGWKLWRVPSRDHSTRSVVPPPPGWRPILDKLNNYASAGEIAQSKICFDRLLEIVPQRQQTVIWNTFLKAHVRAGDVTGAEKLTSAMRQNGVRTNPMTLVKLAGVSASAGLVSKTERLLAELTPPRGRPSTMIDRGNVGKVELSWFSSAVHACGKAGNLCRAEAWLRRLLVAGVTADRMLLGVVIDACARSGERELAENWLSQLSPEEKRSAPGNRHHEDSESGLVDTVSYTALADACAKSGDINGAATWLKKMEDSGCVPNAASYNTVIEACAKRGYFEQASMWLGKMFKAGVVPGTITYNTIISGCAQRGDVDEAVQWLKAMVGAWHQPDVISFNTIIDACAKRGDAVGAGGWLRNMMASGLAADAWSFTAVISSCGDRSSLAAEWHGTMLSAGVRPCVTACNAVINSYAETGDLRGAVHWFERLDSFELRPDAISYNAVIKACAKARQPDVADAWLRRMVLKSVRPSVVTYNTVVSAYSRVGDPEAAADVLREMKEQNVPPTLITYTSAIAACANVHPKLTSMAEQLLDEMLSRRLVPNTVTLQALDRAVGAKRRRALTGKLGEGCKRREAAFSTT